MILNARVENMNCMVSIIIPIYNCERYLDTCLKSIISQTYHNIEIICVNDGSTDNSLNICIDNSYLDTRIQFLNIKHSGVTAARKKGLEIAKGDYVTFVDADDWCDANMIETMVLLADDNVDVVSTRYYLNSTPLEGKWIRPSEGIYEKNKNFEQLYDCFFENEYTGFGSGLYGKLYRKELLVKHLSNIDESIKYAEDALTVYPLLMDSNSIAVCNKCFYHYRENEYSSTKKKNDNYILETKKLIYLLENELKKFPDFEKIQEAFTEYSFELIVRTMQFGYMRHVSRVFVFPFHLIEKSADVIIYGKGDVGKSFIKQINKINYCNIVEVIDKNNVDIIIQNNRILYDYIVIAIANPNMAIEIQEYLIGLGIDKKKLVYERPEVIEGAWQI